MYTYTTPLYSLIFCGPCIIVRLYKKGQQDVLFTFSFIPFMSAGC
jgi:hypothetical protein